VAGPDHQHKDVQLNRVRLTIDTETIVENSFTLRLTLRVEVNDEPIWAFSSLGERISGFIVNKNDRS